MKPAPAEWQLLSLIGPGVYSQALESSLPSGLLHRKQCRPHHFFGKMSATRRWLHSEIHFCKTSTNLKFIAHSIHNQKFSWLAKLLNQLGYLTLESAKPEIETCSVSEQRKCHCCLQIQPHLTCFYNHERSVEELT